MTLQQLESTFKFERRIYRTLLRSLFACAGTLWIVVWFLPNIDANTKTTFSLLQYQMYTILLTLWGMDYKKGEWRLELLAFFGKEEIESESTVESADVIDAHSVFIKRSTSNRYIWYAFTWLLFMLAVIQLIRELLFLFG